MCTANVHRSKTAEDEAKKLGHTAESAGTKSAVIGKGQQLTKEQIDSAKRVVCMEPEHAKEVRRLSPHAKVEVWNIPDEFKRGDARLASYIKAKLRQKR